MHPIISGQLAVERIKDMQAQVTMAQRTACTRDSRHPSHSLLNATDSMLCASTPARRPVQQLQHTADHPGGNLELLVTSQPTERRPEDLVEWAKVILERYA